MSASIQGGRIQVRLFGLSDFTFPLIHLIIRACMNFINPQFQLWNKNILIKVFVELIVKQMVDKPDKVNVEEGMPNENTFKIKIKVDQSDLGKVVGKKGKNIDALRTIMPAVAAKERHRVTLQVLE